MYLELLDPTYTHDPNSNVTWCQFYQNLHNWPSILHSWQKQVCEHKRWHSEITYGWTHNHPYTLTKTFRHIVACLLPSQFSTCFHMVLAISFFHSCISLYIAFPLFSCPSKAKHYLAKIGYYTTCCKKKKQKKSKTSLKYVTWRKFQQKIKWKVLNCLVSHIRCCQVQ